MNERPDRLNLSQPSGRKQLKNGRWYTLCESTNCPNIKKCLANGACSFMILGDICTRGCRFCTAKRGRPAEINLDEAQEIASTVKQSGIKHAVITSLTRDDLPDGGAGQFGAVIRAIRREIPECTIEVIIPDFQGSVESLSEVIDAKPDIINHNIKTVPSIYPIVGAQVSYDKSIQLLQRVNELENDIWIKSGLLLGLGENREEVEQVIKELHTAGCNILTMGQYSPPSREQIPVEQYVHPLEFKEMERTAYKIGFIEVAAGPLIRSCYNSAVTLKRIRNRKGGK